MHGVFDWDCTVLSCETYRGLSNLHLPQVNGVTPNDESPFEGEGDEALVLPHLLSFLPAVQWGFGVFSAQQWAK